MAGTGQGDDRPPVVLGRQLLHRGLQHGAGGAPVLVEEHQHRLMGVQHAGLELGLVLDRHEGFAWPAAGAAADKGQHGV